MSRPRPLYVFVALVAVLAVSVGVTQRVVASSSSSHLSATDRVKAHPPPPLFTDQQVATVATEITAQQGRADRAMATWWATHGAAPDDQAFVAWVEDQVPAPPTPKERRSELRRIEALKAERTPARVRAATWLEVYGKKDVWKLYQHDQRELETQAMGQRDKKAVKTVLSLSKTAADQLAQRYQQSAPYVLDPSLRTDHVVKKGAVCPCSYPSRHAARAAAARTYLGFVAPRRAAEYRWMESQVGFSRLLMAGHVQSDISAGSLLGDMIGQYVLVSRGRMAVPAA